MADKFEKKEKKTKKAGITIRPAVADDAQKIGAVFDGAVFEGWKYLGDLASRPDGSPGGMGQGCGRTRAEQMYTGSYEVAGYRRDGTVRESEFRGVHLREPRLAKAL